MKCIYLSEEMYNTEVCRTVAGSVYTPTDEDKQQFCYATFLNCPRYNAYQQHLGTNILVQSRDTAFPLARSVINQSNAYDDEFKRNIITRVDSLEESVIQNNSQETQSKWSWIKDNAGVIVPILQTIITEVIKKAG